MKKQLKTEIEERIIGDPYITEATWLPACAATGSTLSCTQKTDHSALKSIAIASVLSTFVSMTGVFATHLGYDWGFKFIDAFFGQGNASNQGVMANVLLSTMIAPLFLGLSFASFHPIQKTGRNLLCSTILLSVVLLLGNLTLKLGLDWSIFSLDALPYWLTSIAFCTFGISVASVSTNNLRKRIRLKPVYISAIACIGTMGIATYMLPDKTSWYVEMAIYSILLFGTGVISSRLAKAHTRVAAMLIAMVATAPFLLSNLANVLLTSSSLILDSFNHGFSLGWQALASALSISLVALSSTLAGGLLGQPRNDDMKVQLAKDPENKKLQELISGMEIKLSDMKKLSKETALP